MGILYSASIVDIALTLGGDDLFELTAPDDAAVAIEEVLISQYSDAGDAQAEMLSIELIRGYTTAGSGGTALTPRPFNAYAAAASATVDRNNTTAASAGTPHVLVSDSFNVQAGYQWRAPLPRPWETEQQYNSRRMIVKPGEIWVAHISKAPADEITVNATLIFEELRKFAVA